MALVVGEAAGVALFFYLLKGGLDPGRFFRINRSCIPALSAIESAVVSAGRYKVEINPQPEDVSTLVTRSREDEFIGWLEKV